MEKHAVIIYLLFLFFNPKVLIVQSMVNKETFVVKVSERVGWSAFILQQMSAFAAFSLLGISCETIKQMNFKWLEGMCVWLYMF